MRKNILASCLLISFLLFNLCCNLIPSWAGSEPIKKAEELKAKACQTNDPDDWQASQEEWERLAEEGQLLGFSKDRVLKLWIEEIWASQKVCRPKD